MGADWISILNTTSFLPSFSTTDVVVKLTPKTEEEGYYCIYLSLYLKNIPEKIVPISVSGVSGDSETNISSGDGRESHSFVVSDVHIFEMRILCSVEIPPKEPEPIEREVESKEEMNYQTIGLSTRQLNFGVIPKGIKVTKTFHIKNLTNEKIPWRLRELQFRNNKFHVPRRIENVSCTDGTLKGNSTQKIKYTVEAKDPIYWISALVVFSCPPCTCNRFIIETICLVIYKVDEPKISIRTDCNLPVLCPREFIYVGIPSYHTVYVHNGGLLPGCFYFLKPKGTDSDKVQIRLKPQSGVLPPNATVEVKVKLTGLESGIFEDICVPCFVGDLEMLASLRVLCCVTSINVHFYLPNKDEGYDKFLWPLKSETPSWKFDMSFGENEVSNGGEWLTVAKVPSSHSLDDIFFQLTSNDTVIATYPTVRIKQVQVKKAAKLTFYVENLTPIQGHFTVNATNYGPEDDCINHVLVKAKTRTPEFFWDKSCLDGYGIVVEPTLRTGDILSYEVIQINLWIYANTWGKYLEEVMVEINDLTPFCFNLLVEVEGLPIEFPFARNTILPFPTIRFENISYSTHDNARNFIVTNISCIPVHIDWYIFHRSPHRETEVPFNLLLEFDDDDTPKVVLSTDCQGCAACNSCVSVEPRVSLIEKQSTVTVGLTVSSTGFVPNKEKTCIKFDLLGFVGAQSCDKFKENYFKRDTGVDLKPAKVEVLVTMELPIMEVDLTSDETRIDIFVNDILLNKHKFPEIYVILRNVDVSPIHFSIELTKPFKISEARTVPTGITDIDNLVLRRHECLQMLITCHFSHEELLQYADLIYQRDEVQNFTSVIIKNLNIYQQGLTRQMIPLEIRLHYPHIEVKPSFIKFGHCLLYRSKKCFFHIYNMTGSNVKFEIFKTTKCEHFEVYPNHGDIPKSTGANKQFVDVAVFFTPRHCKLYLECIRVMTNIPQYYIDLPVGGYGTNDEKFNEN